MVVIAAVAVVIGAGVARARCSADGRGDNCFALFAQGLWAGVTIGAVTGGVVGTLVVGVVSLVGGGPTGSATDVVLTPFGAAYGLVAGTLLAVVPSVVGAAAVTAVVSRRHPLPATQEALERQLEGIFQAVVVLLDAAVVALLLATGTSAAGAVVAVPTVAAANGCVAVMLCRNRGPMARAWVAVRH